MNSVMMRTHGSATLLKTPADSAEITAVVCIPTYRRAESLRSALFSLSLQRGSTSFAVIVIDNDPAQLGAVPVAKDYLSSKLQGKVAVEHNHGKSYALNHALKLAFSSYPSAKYILMMDDNEIAGPNWVATLVETAKLTGYDIIGGPVHPKFSGRASAAARGHKIFAPAFSATGPIPTLYDRGNCLISRTAFEALDNPQFDLRYNDLDGGDADFFARCKKAGLQFYWQQEAEMTKTIPSSRANAKWIVQRGIRTGAVNYQIERQAIPSRIAVAPVVKNFATLPLAVARGIGIFVTTRSWLRALHPASVAIGRIKGSFLTSTAIANKNS